LAAPGPTVRVGTLRFGTASWEIDVILRNGIDKAHGVTIEPVEFATNQATQVALQAKSVDLILVDWLFVARQRAEGADWTFAPFSTSVGALMAPEASRVRTIADLPGTRLGIAGSPLDKSWLILQAYAKRKFGLDLDSEVKKNFGAPPLLAQQLQAGQIDSMLTYWPNAAKAEAAGMRRILAVEEAVSGLGIEATVPFVGYVFSAGWANRNRAAIDGFLAATHEAGDRLAKSDEEWLKVRPLMGAANDGEFEKLKEAYRRGILRQWGAAEQKAAGQLYEIMAQIGGADLVGPSSQISPGTFW
jgi:NitT/TauT family transport system substrate-binding protein